MVSIRLGESIFLKSDQGQSTVEYLFLIGMMVLISTTILRSDRFQQSFGSQGQVFEAFRTRFEYSYQHGMPTGPVGSPAFHPSYSPRQGETRFFSGKGAYPP